VFIPLILYKTGNVRLTAAAKSDMVRDDHQNGESEQGIVSRRDYLRLSAAAVGTGALTASGAVGKTAAVPTDDPSADEPLVGGGKYYENDVTRSDATEIVASESDIKTAVETAGSGDTIWIEDGTYDLTDEAPIQVEVNDVTIAGNRGINGSNGPLLKVQQGEKMNGVAIFDSRNVIRVTGLQLRGPYYERGYWDPPVDPTVDPEFRPYWSVGIYALPEKGQGETEYGVEVDNCHLWGWSEAAVQIGAKDYQTEGYIHDCSIHSNAMEHLGYGVDLYNGRSLIERCYFDLNRHSIDGFGYDTNGYEARDNLVGSNPISHAFDMHGDECIAKCDNDDDESEETNVVKRAGDKIHIHHNTFRFVHEIEVPGSDIRDGSVQEAVTIRGIPKNQVLLENNWFYHNTQPDETNIEANGQAYRQKFTYEDHWTKFIPNGDTHHFGTDEPSLDIGHPRPGDGDDGNGSLVAEVGTVSQDADSWQSVSFDSSYNNPVVVMKPVSQFNGENPCHARVRNVTGSGFEYKLEEWEYTPDGHRSENVSYLVMEQGTHTASNGTRIDVGTTTTDEHFTTVTLQNLRHTPAVFTQTQTVNGPNAVVTRNTHVDATNFETRLQEQNARSSGTAGHVDESVGYIALEPGNVNFGTKTVEVGRQAGMTDSWTRLGFTGSYSSPAFVADMQTTNDGDTATLRYKDLDAGGTDIQVEEEQSEDTEISHDSETVGYFVTTGSGPL
jgi:hypothetical protein